eukprot:jgi/Pico_ML_1/51200/g2277.t1
MMEDVKDKVEATNMEDVKEAAKEKLDDLNEQVQRSDVEAFKDEAGAKAEE